MENVGVEVVLGVSPVAGLKNFVLLDSPAFGALDFGAVSHVAVLGDAATFSLALNALALRYGHERLGTWIFRRIDPKGGLMDLPRAETYEYADLGEILVRSALGAPLSTYFLSRVSLGFGADLGRLKRSGSVLGRLGASLALLTRQTPRRLDVELADARSTVDVTDFHVVVSPRPSRADPADPRIAPGDFGVFLHPVESKPALVLTHFLGGGRRAFGFAYREEARSPWIRLQSSEELVLLADGLELKGRQFELRCWRSCLRVAGV